MVPEAIQIVVSGLPRDKRDRDETYRVLRLLPTGVSALRSCQLPSYSFHPHDEDLMWDDVHKKSYKFSRRIKLEVIDFRDEA